MKKLLAFAGMVALMLLAPGGPAVQGATDASIRGRALLAFGAGSDVGAMGAEVHAVVSGDLDHDGDSDLVAGDSGGNIVAWENDGTPFTDLWTPGVVGACGDSVYSLALADLDHDGDLDVVSGCGGGATYEVVAWENDGTPFTGGWVPNGVGGAADVLAVVAGDLDHDGWVDIVCGASDAVIGAWRNDGTPFTGTWTTYQMVGNTTSATYTLDLGDLDHDGRPDLVSGDANQEINVWRNDGTPFADLWSANLVGNSKDTVRAVALGDLNGDGALDIVSALEYPDNTTHTVAGWKNDGTPFSGVWELSTIGSSAGPVNGVAVGDLDGDGDLDVASGSGAAEDYEVIAWYNPTAPFVDTWTQEDVGASADNVNGVALADLDHDGDIDLVSASGAAEDFELIAWENTRTPETLGNWTEVTQPLPVFDMQAAAVSDLNHDGLLDVAAGSVEKGLYVWLGDGGYHWDQVGATHLPNTGTWNDVAWGQINNRNELDLVAANDQDGLGAWVAWEQGTVWDDISSGLPTTGEYRATDLGDINHDGLLDLVAGGWGVGVQTWEGTGSSWVHQKVFSDTVDFCDVGLGYVDDDGDLDVAAAACGDQGIAIWLGDGGFGAAGMTAPVSSGSYAAVALGDMDNDGDTDVIAAPSGGGVQIWKGDGGASWADTGTIGTGLTVLSLDMGDYDNDGYLDILAGLKGGIKVWRGDGGGSWSDASMNLPATGNFHGVVFGRVDGDAALDIIAGETGATGVRAWTALEPPPGGWANFQPQTSPPWLWVRDQVVTATVEVADAGSGLDISTAAYRFSRDGGTTWIGDTGDGGWQAAGCSGTDGVLSTQVMTATNVPFNQDSGTRNAIQFRISDLEELVGTSPVYYVAIDATPPTNPGTVESTSHTPGVWNSSPSVAVTWSDGVDATSGAWSYSYDLTTSATTLPDETWETSGNSGADSAGSDGQNWYFHLRTGDRAGNWATGAVHIGPFWIDKTYPINPDSLWSSSHSARVWSNDPTVSVAWTPGDDGDGSGIAGYWYSWARSQQSDPMADHTSGTSALSFSLGTGNDWYFNLRTRDNVSRRAVDALHLGPFYIDTLRPYSEAHSPASVHTVLFGVYCTAYESPLPQSGVSGCDIQYKDKADGIWHNWVTDRTPGVSINFGGLLGHTYCFRSRAHDIAGNVELWPSATDGDTCTGISTDLTISALEVTQAIQNLANGVPLAQDKNTWVRVYAASSEFNVDDVDARLYGVRGGSALPGSPLAPQFRITARTDGGDRENLRDAFLFYLPSSWREGNVTLTAEVNSAHTIAEDNYINNERARTVTFQATDPLCLDMVRVHTHPRTASIDDAGFWDIVEMTRRIYPVSEVWIYRGGTVYPVWHDFGSEYDLPDDFDWVLSRVWWYNVWHDDPDECSETYYWGMIHPDHLSGRWGMAYLDGHNGTGVMDVSTSFDTSCSGGGTSRCYPYWMYPLGGYTLAHELGHNFDRKHVDCNDPDDVDHSYPYNDCNIADNDPGGYYGLVWPIGYSVGAPEIIAPTDAAPLMSYGWPMWVDDYTYRALFNRLDFLSVQDMGPQPSGQAAGTYLLTSGLITQTNDTAAFDYFYRWDEIKPSLQSRLAPQSLAAGAAYSLTLESAAGQILYTHTFSPSLASVGMGITDSLLFFGEILPWDAATARIALYHQGVELAARVVSANAPTVTISAPAGGESFSDSLSITWEGADADPGDELVYTVRYSPDDGATWHTVVTGWPWDTFTLSDTLDLAGSDQARIQVIASDGVNTGSDITSRFSLSRHAPEAKIIEPGDYSSFGFGDTVVLRGATLDPEDGPVAADDQFTWHSDISGTLGTGPELAVTTLPTGTHRITLTTVDSDGMSGTDTVTVLVGMGAGKLYLPVVLKLP